MIAEIRVSAVDELSEFAGLWGWLKGERDLYGAVRPVPSQPREGELGSGIDVLTVALGSGGAGVALAKSLTTWLQSRRAGVSISVTTPSGSVELTADQAKDALPLLRHIFQSDDES